MSCCQSNMNSKYTAKFISLLLHITNTCQTSPFQKWITKENLLADSHAHNKIIRNQHVHHTTQGYDNKNGFTLLSCKIWSSSPEQNWIEQNNFIIISYIQINASSAVSTNFVLSTFNVSSLALNRLLKLAKTSFMEVWKYHFLGVT
jgi:hypothetical protein